MDSAGMIEMEAPESSRRKVSDLRFLSLFLFGFAFVRAWDVLFTTELTSAFGVAPWAGEDVVHIGKLPVFLVFAIIGGRIAPLHGHPRSISAAGFSMVAAAILLAACQYFELPKPLLVVCALLGGTGAALSIIIWAELQSCFNAFLMTLYIAGAFFLGSLVGWMMLGTEGIRFLVALLLLPLLSHVCIKVGYLEVPSGQLPSKAAGLRLGFPWKLAIVLGVYEFAFGFHQVSPSFSNGLYAVGVAIASAAVFLFVYLAVPKQFDFTQMWRMPFVLVVCGMVSVFLPFAVQGTVSNVLVSVGYTMIFLLFTVLLCDLARRYGVSAALLCSIEQLVMYTKIGGQLSGVYAQSGTVAASDVNMTVSVVLVVAVVLASILMLSQREMSKWAPSMFGMEAVLEQEASERMEIKAEAFAKEYGLSPRETEVFKLLATDASASEIEQSLCIASGTLKSHTRRIYQKLDIHSRGELHALFEGSGNSSSHN